MKIDEKNLKNQSDIIFNKRVAIETGHSIDWYHTLDGIFGELSFASLFLGPYDSKGGVQLCIPVVGLGDDNRGSFTLHDHGIDEVLEGFLSGYKFFHDSLVDLIDPMGYLSFFVVFIAQYSINGLVDDFFQLFGGELDLF